MRRIPFILTVGLFLPTLGGCSFDPGGIAVPDSCGNGIIDPGEECDGDALGNASCATLQLGSGTLTCNANCTYNTAGCDSGSQCGDNVVEGGEECDDGNTTDCDGCNANCVVEQCGNGVEECGEECDDANTVAGDGCSSQCRLESTAFCGDGAVDPGEECDSTTVNSTCVDEGFAGGTLGCAPDCQSYDTTGCTRDDGEPCQQDAQCVGGTCYQEADDGWPGGFCTRECGSPGPPCEPGFACVNLGSTSRCYRMCATSGECRDGYFCRPDPFQGSENVCRPRCESDAHCPDGGICNLWTGLCDGPPDPAESDNGEACGDFLAECKGACWSSPPSGYCLSSCALSTGFCPGDGVCTDLDGVADLGYCLDGCSGGADCGRYNYSCQSNPWGGADVCWHD